MFSSSRIVEERTITTAALENRIIKKVSWSDEVDEAIDKGELPATEYHPTSSSDDNPSKDESNIRESGKMDREGWKTGPQAREKTTSKYASWIRECKDMSQPKNIWRAKVMRNLDENEELRGRTRRTKLLTAWTALAPIRLVTETSDDSTSECVDENSHDANESTKYAGESYWRTFNRRVRFRAVLATIREDVAEEVIPMDSSLDLDYGYPLPPPKTVTTSPSQSPDIEEDSDTFFDNTFSNSASSTSSNESVNDNNDDGDDSRECPSGGYIVSLWEEDDDSEDWEGEDHGTLYLTYDPEIDIPNKLGETKKPNEIPQLVTTASFDTTTDVNGIVLEASSLALIPTATKSNVGPNNSSPFKIRLGGKEAEKRKIKEGRRAGRLDLSKRLKKGPKNAADLIARLAAKNAEAYSRKVRRKARNLAATIKLNKVLKTAAEEFNARLEARLQSEETIAARREATRKVLREEKLAALYPEPDGYQRIYYKWSKIAEHYYKIGIMPGDSLAEMKEKFLDYRVRRGGEEVTWTADRFAEAHANMAGTYVPLVAAQRQGFLVNGYTYDSMGKIRWPF